MTPDVGIRFKAAALTLGLTAKQIEFLFRVASGQTQAKVAYKLNIKDPSGSLSRAYEKLGAQHRGHAISIVFEQALREAGLK
ncbi:MAG TPA: LuxR C-terminal-related transcriptional regulator [Armatimonadota bacterium]|nr:LuxR C-terminal-related transcriptional regulator [Armatimonadota bacterium]